MPAAGGAAADFRGFLTFLLDNRGLIAAVTLVIAALGAIYAVCAAPVYEASILVQVKDAPDTPSSILGESVAKALDLKTAASAEMEVLRSRTVAARAVEETKTYIDVEPDYFPLIGPLVARLNPQISSPGILGFGGYAWGSERADISIFEVPPQLQGREFKLLARKDDSYILQEEESGLEIPGRVGEILSHRVGGGELQLRVDRLLARPDASFTLRRVPDMDAVEQLQGSLKILERGKQSGVISVSLQGEDRERIRNVIDAVGREYIDQNEARKSEDAEKSLSFLDRQLPAVKQEMESAESRYNEFRNKHGVVDLGEEARQSLQQSVTAQTRLFDLRQRRQEMLVRFQEEHPTVVAVNQQIGVVSAELKSLAERIRKLPGIEQDAVRLARDVKVYTDLYTSLLGTSQQLRLMAESRAGNVRLLDAAAYSLKPVRPWRSLLLVLSVLAGLAIGITVAAARKSICRRISYPHEVEQRFGMPVSAVIPHAERPAALVGPSTRAVPRGASVALPYNKPPGTVVESLRRFRTSLRSAMASNDNNIVVITGPTPGVGKSFVAANFATVLAADGKQVLLVDSDLRTGRLHRQFALRRGPGLADVLDGAMSVEQAIHRNVAGQVDFLSCGMFGEKDPGELLSGERFTAMLREMGKRYDHVLVDTAPVLNASDVLMFGACAGATFCVVRAGVTTEDEIEETVRQLRLAGIEPTGTVFNDLKSRSSKYGYGARYAGYEVAG